MIVALALLIAGAAAPIAADGISVAKRLVAAIQGKAQFADGDFVRPLEASDKAALRTFASCRVAHVDYMLMPDPTETETYTQNHDEVMVIFNCKGAPVDSPAGLSVYLKSGKIGTIETHNADLMRTR